MGSKLCKPCFNKNKNSLQDGSVLDRVISQASSADQCLLYKLANYKKGGELIVAYNVGGQMEVEKLIKEQFAVLMYADGKGKIINRSEYLRWKFRDNENVVLPIEAALSMHDPLAKWKDHEACWQMQYRGSLGETLLHVLIICDTKMHTKLARTLIKCFPKLAVDVVEGEEYLGASSLHLAIAYNNNELVQDLIGAGANVNQRAIGSFFLPRDQQKMRPARNTDYEGLAYLGEYPLAWAACCANESVYNLLLDCGAHPDLQDHFGNMILHMVVVGDKLDMFGYALRHPKLPASNGIVNKAGLTPLTLACKLGRAEVFREMLELSAKEFWRYSNITCSAYPLNALDTLLPDGRTNWNSALFIILNGTKEEHLDMLDGGIIARLLEEKWKTFARNQFLKRLLILFIHLFCLSLAVYLRPTDPEESLLAPVKDALDIVRYACEIGTVLGVISYVVFQQGDEIKNQGIITFLKQQSHAPAKAIFLMSNLLILACIPCRLLGDQQTEEAILLVAVPGSWFLLMFFAGAVRLTGPFVTMIYSMITGDMLTFGIIYTVVLFGFSQSFFFLYKGYPNVSSTLFNSYASTWMALFQITLGDYNYSELAMTTYPVLSKTVFALFMVFVPILLLNMLIAMMGNTYAHVIEQSEKEWMKQWAKIVVTLEMAVKQSDAHNYLQEYSISLGPANDDPTVETRGVMVIKSKSKTRAKQRKGAVSNWKRVGKVTIAALRKRGLTGEELRCLMWGRESINTPVKLKKNPKGANLMNGLGGALTSAFDVMALAGDINISEQQNNAININKNNEKVQKPPNSQKDEKITNVNVTSTFKNDEVKDTGSSMFGTFMNLANSPSAENKDQTNQPPTNQPTQQFDDPLTKLVFLSQSETNLELMNSLAKEAANIPSEFDELVQRPVSQMSIKNLTGLFSLKETCIKQLETSIKNKLQFLDHSESESLEMSILGKLSRTRRAKSISIRAVSARPKVIEKKGWNYLQQSDSSSSESANSMNLRQMAKDEELDYAEDRIARIKDTLQQEDLKITDSSTMRPIYIDAALGNDIANIHTNLIEGNDVENKTVLENNIKNKSKSKSRSKTAKANRIAPKCDVVQRRGASADQKKNENDLPSEYPNSSPDYLEPWSVRGISNMNTILAWDAEPQSE